MPHVTISSKCRPVTAKSATNAEPLTTSGVPLRSIFDQLPDSAWLRESQLVRSSKRPESTAPLPFSAPTLWRMVKAGKFPAPIKLSARVTAWRCGEVRNWMTAQAAAKGRHL
jgi:prophage regulatory protein